MPVIQLSARLLFQYLHRNLHSLSLLLFRQLGEPHEAFRVHDYFLLVPTQEYGIDVLFFDLRLIYRTK